MALSVVDTAHDGDKVASSHRNMQTKTMSNPTVSGVNRPRAMQKNSANSNENPKGFGMAAMNKFF